MTALSLEPRQAMFAREVASGSEPFNAAVKSGYANPRSAAFQLMHSPRVLDAISAALFATLQGDAAPAAIAFLNAVVKGEGAYAKFPAGARVDAAKTLLDRAGIVARKEAPGGAEKDLGELSTEELHKRIEALEAELGDRAKASLPADAPAIDAQLSELIS